MGSVDVKEMGSVKLNWIPSVMQVVEVSKLSLILLTIVLMLQIFMILVTKVFVNSTLVSVTLLKVISFVLVGHWV